MEMKEKVCIITGAASGIGKEIAARFAREGGKVVIADLEKCASIHSQHIAEALQYRGN